MIQLSKEGKDFFYKGELAQLICNNFGEEGFLTKDSLKQYKPYQRSPITYSINEYTIITNPAPSYAGTLMVFLFNVNNATSFSNLLFLNTWSNKWSNSFCSTIKLSFNIKKRDKVE